MGEEGLDGRKGRKGSEKQCCGEKENGIRKKCEMSVTARRREKKKVGEREQKHD